MQSGPVHPQCHTFRFDPRRVGACDRPASNYDDSLRRQNIQSEGADNPAAASPVPFDVRLAHLNAQIRQAKGEHAPLRLVDVYA